LQGAPEILFFVDSAHNYLRSLAVVDKNNSQEDLVRLQRQHKQSQMVTNQSFFMGHPDSRQKLGRIVRKPLEVSMHELT